MTYAIKEAFYTLQGEGMHAGSPAVFVRFSGCNAWSGRAEHRERDAAKGLCARWCDTNFVGTDGENGGRYDAQGVVETVRRLWPTTGPALAVLTGGEPLLQADAALVDALHAADVRVHVETNGSICAPVGIDWITLSPKPPMPVVAQRFNEVKVVLAPNVDPEMWGDYAVYRFVQPLWHSNTRERQRLFHVAVEYVKGHPNWRLSLQMHKMVGIQ